MTLVYVDDETRKWYPTESINGYKLAPNIEDLYTEAELIEKFGLKKKPVVVVEKTRDDWKELVNDERSRRIAAGQTVTLSDGRTFTMQTRSEEDFRNINGMVSKAIVLTLQQSATTVSMNDAANVEQEFTPAQMIEVGSVVGAKVDEIYKCSFKLKAMDPIPTDYNDDKYWSLSYYA